MIYVCPLSAVEIVIADYAPSHLVTLINEETMIATPSGIAAGNHLKLPMNDIHEPQDGFVAPSDGHVSELLAFGRNWDTQAPMLIHCWAGISRSTAAAYSILCALNPGADEQAIAQALRTASPTASPNRRIVALADAALGREGRMISAIADIGRGELAMEATPFSLPIKY